METDFRALLLAAVTSLVATRVYPTNYPQNAPSPAVRYKKATGADGLHMQGVDGLNFDVMQIDARMLIGGDGVAAAAIVESIRNAILSALNPYSSTQGSTQFQLIRRRDDRGVQFETNGAQQFFTTSLDFDVIWRAA